MVKINQNICKIFNSDSFITVLKIRYKSNRSYKQAYKRDLLYHYFFNGKKSMKYFLFEYELCIIKFILSYIIPVGFLVKKMTNEVCQIKQIYLLKKRFSFLTN